MFTHYRAMDFGLDESINLLRDHVSAFARECIAPIAGDIDRDNAFPNPLWPKLGEMGSLA